MALTNRVDYGAVWGGVSAALARGEVKEKAQSSNALLARRKTNVAFIPNRSLASGPLIRNYREPILCRFSGRLAERGFCAAGNLSRAAGL